MDKPLSSVELKAKAYDILAQIENLQGMLRQVNNAIGEANKRETANIPSMCKDEVKEE